MKKNFYLSFAFLMVWVSKDALAQTTAIKSDDFVGRIGVNTHFGYGGTPYVDSYSTVKTLIGNLGIRYFREGTDPDNLPNVTKIKDICNTYGMKVQGIIPANAIATGTGFNVSLVAPLIDKIKNKIGPQYYLNMEGLNEPDNFNDNNPTNWPTNARAVQTAMYNKMKSDPAWANVPVLGPSAAAGNSYALIGDMKPITDKGNLHWYPSGIQPSHQEFNYYEYSYDQARLNNYSDTRPIVLTETGYSNSGGTQSCGENAAAKYIPRTFMYFLYVKGMEKVFTYEFMNEANSVPDPESNFGLVRNNLTVKPSYTSLQNTITLLKEPGANFTPGQLNYTLTGDMTNIYQKLFQKSNGKFYLVIWQEAKSYDVPGKKDIIVPDRAITLNLNGGGIGLVKTYRPAPAPIGNGLTAINSYTNPTSVNLSVPDQLLIVEITPGTVVATGSLTGSVSLNKTAVSLSTVGVNDWKHFDNNDHKASGTMINSISDYTTTGGTPASYNNDLRKMSWTGGTPTASFTNNAYGWYKSGIGTGFSFTSVAGNGNNTLKIYVGGYNSGGTLTAHLSNNSAPDYVNTVANTAGQWDAVYTIDYNAAQTTGGQNIVLTWKQASGTGNVTIQGAALIGTTKSARKESSLLESNQEPTSDITIYPNPTTDELNIQLNGIDDVDLYDSMGKIMHSKHEVSGLYKINMRTFTPGMYLLRTKNSVQKVMKIE